MLPILAVAIGLLTLIFVRTSGSANLSTSSELQDAMRNAELALETEELGREVDPGLRAAALDSAKKLDQYAKDDPTRYTYVYSAGMCYLAAQQYTEAEERLRLALKIAPQTPSGNDAQAVADIHHRLGRALFFKGDFKAALAESQAAIDMVSKPGMVPAPEYWWGRAAIEVQLGKKKEALLDIEQALKLNPEHPPSLALQKYLRNLGVY